jgi:hypothetical protein
MSIFTAEECDRMIAALKCRLIEDPGGSAQSMSIDGYTITYAGADDLLKRIRMFQNLKDEALRSDAGVRRGLGSVADFRNS